MILQFQPVHACCRLLGCNWFHQFPVLNRLSGTSLLCLREGACQCTLLRINFCLLHQHFFLKSQISPWIYAWPQSHFMQNSVWWARDNPLSSESFGGVTCSDPIPHLEAHIYSVISCFLTLNHGRSAPILLSKVMSWNPLTWLKLYSGQDKWMSTRIHIYLIV